MIQRTDNVDVVVDDLEEVVVLFVETGKEPENRKASEGRRAELGVRTAQPCAASVMKRALGGVGRVGDSHVRFAAE